MLLLLVLFVLDPTKILDMPALFRAYPELLLEEEEDREAEEGRVDGFIDSALFCWNV